MDVLLPFPFRTYSPLFHKSDVIPSPAKDYATPISSPKIIVVNI